MNQIIQENLNKNKINQYNPNNKAKNFYIEISNEVTEIPYGSNLKISFNKNKLHTIKNFVTKSKYQLQFVLSTIVAIIFLFILFGKLYQNNQKEKIAKELLNKYQLTTLYSDTSSYNTTDSNYNISLQNPFVIGMIKIDKLNLNYPILSESNDELLKISVCRFMGPMPNETGNLCIAGHNYIDNRFFSNLNELDIGDNIEIYGLLGEKKDYQVFRKYEVNYDDTFCTDQNVGNDIIVTLLTCDNMNNNKRLVIQAINI